MEWPYAGRSVRAHQNNDAAEPAKQLGPTNRCRYCLLYPQLRKLPGWFDGTSAEDRSAGLNLLPCAAVNGCGATNGACCNDLHDWVTRPLEIYQLKSCRSIT